MPGILTQDTPFKTITVKPLHPTFAAEVIGVDWPDPSDEQFQEIKAAMAKVSITVAFIAHHTSRSKCRDICTIFRLYLQP
jgi:hypothetical protein